MANATQTETGAASDSTNATRLLVVSITEALAAIDYPGAVKTTLAAIAEAGVALDTIAASNYSIVSASINEAGFALDITYYVTGLVSDPRFIAQGEAFDGLVSLKVDYSTNADGGVYSVSHNLTDYSA